MKKEMHVVLTPAIRNLRNGLETHPVFAQIADIEALRRFMQVHVFAVWDFMSLAKRLQRDLTCVTLPWLPPSDPVAARLINDIVLAEESDIDAQGQPASHLDLYLTAMAEVGADASLFREFLSRVSAGEEVGAALVSSGAPQFVRDFVGHTMDTALRGTTLQTMTSFFYGRENVIPAMFQSLLDRWGLGVEQAPGFVYYLQRHIELDGDSHGPAANRMVQNALEREPQRLEEARTAARMALQARHALWDGTLALLLESAARRHPQAA